jgi:hypothetical protein
MSQRTFESQFAELAVLHLDALESGDWVARMNYESRIEALKREQLDIANARISELEAEIVTARADALRDVQRIKADRDQGMLDYCALMERYDAAIENQTTEETPCSQRS